MQASEGDSANNVRVWGWLIPVTDTHSSPIHLYQLPHRIGRSEQNNTVFNHREISAKHCTITLITEEGTPKTSVSDHSCNGTFINDKKIGLHVTQILNDGDKISFLRDSMTFIYRRQVPVEQCKKYVVKAQGKSSSVTRAWEGSQMYLVKTIPNQWSRGHVHSVLDCLYSPSFGHRNICKVKEAFWDFGVINFVLEGVPIQLRSFIIKEKGLSEVQTQALTYQICDALVYMHVQGIPYGNLKSENIFLTSEIEPIVKVADLGIPESIDIKKGLPLAKLPLQSTHSFAVGMIVLEMLTQSNSDSMQNHLYVDCAVCENWSPAAKRFIRCLLGCMWILDDWSAAAECICACLMGFDGNVCMSLNDALTDDWLAAERKRALDEAGRDD